MSFYKHQSAIGGEKEKEKVVNMCMVCIVNKAGVYTLYYVDIVVFFNLVYYVDIVASAVSLVM